MDALLFMILTIVIVVKSLNKPDDIKTTELLENTNTVERVAKLNDSFYEDSAAFSEIIHALGFPKES